MIDNNPFIKARIGRMLLLLVLLIAFAGTTCYAQINNDDNSAPKDTKGQKEYYKRKKEQDKAVEKATKAALKHQRDIQSPEVRKRMKHDDRKAQRYNDHKGEPFFKKLFRKKEPRGKPNKQTDNTNPK